MPTLKEHYGPWALVTGASAGIGEAYVKRLATEGFNIVATARRQDRLAKLCQEMEVRHGILTLPITEDLSDPEGPKRLIDAVSQLEIGLLINNAGYGSNGHFHELDPEKEARMVILNCYAPIVITRALLPAMVSRKRGGVVFLSSTGANQPVPCSATYCATKGFNQFMGEALFEELKRYGVDAVAIQPGPTRTEFQVNADYVHDGKIRTPEDVVTTTFKAIGKKPVGVDGMRNKIMKILAQTLPRRFVVSFSRHYALAHQKKR